MEIAVGENAFPSPMSVIDVPDMDLLEKVPNKSPTKAVDSDGRV